VQRVNANILPTPTYTPTAAENQRNPPPTPIHHQSILTPPITARHALEEARHRLVSTPDLHLEESRLLAVASLGGTLRARFLRVVPGSRPAEDVLSLLALEDAAGEDGFGDGVLVGAGSAPEAVFFVRQEDDEDVCAVRADWRPDSQMGWSPGIGFAYRGAWLSRCVQPDPGVEFRGRGE